MTVSLWRAFLVLLLLTRSIIDWVNSNLGTYCKDAVGKNGDNISAGSEVQRYQILMHVPYSIKNVAQSFLFEKPMQKVQKIDGHVRSRGQVKGWIVSSTIRLWYAYIVAKLIGQRLYESHSRWKKVFFDWIAWTTLGFIIPTKYHRRHEATQAVTSTKIITRLLDSW